MPRVVKKIKSVTIGPCTLYLGRYQDVFLEIEDKVDLVVTDPPYGCRYPSMWNPPAGKSHHLDFNGKFAFDEISGNDVIDGEWVAYPQLKSGGAIYSFCTWDSIQDWTKAIIQDSKDLKVKSCIVWDKVIHGAGDLVGAYGPRHEMILLVANQRHILRRPRPQIF